MEPENKTDNRARWIGFGFLSAGFLGSNLTITLLPLLVLQIEKDLSISHGLAGILITVLMGASGLGRFIEGMLVDRMGKAPSIFASGLLYVIGVIGFGLSRSYPAAIVFVFALGLANGLFSPLGFSLVSHMFADIRGKMIGIYDSLFPISALLAYGLNTLNYRFGTWRFSIFVIGAIVFVSFSGLLIYGSIRLAEYLKPYPSDRLSLTQYATRIKNEVLNSPVFLHISMLIVPISLVINGFMQFLPPYLVEGRGLSPSNADLLYMLFMGISTVGKLSSGWFVPKLGTRFTMFAYAATGVLGLALVTLSPVYPLMLAGLFMLSPARGGVFTLMHVHLLENLPDSSRDLLYGFFMVFLILAGSIGPLTVGFIVQQFSFYTGFVVLTLVFSLSLPVIYFFIGKGRA